MFALRTVGRPVIDLTNETFGQLTVLCRQGVVNGHRAGWLVQCSCGCTFTAAGSQLKNGKTWRCIRCAGRERSARQRKHGETKHPLYRTWLDIRNSSRKPGFQAEPTLTGRGRPICPQWAEDYPQFARDIRQSIGPRPTPLHTLILNDGQRMFQPGAVRWATRPEWMAGFETKGHARRDRATGTPQPRYENRFTDLKIAE